LIIYLLHYRQQVEQVQTALQSFRKLILNEEPEIAQDTSILDAISSEEERIKQMVIERQQVLVCSQSSDTIPACNSS